MTELPYAGTTGWSGSDTSKERAVEEAGDGTAGFRQRAVLSLIQACGTHGLTVVDVRNRLDFHHGQASAALTALHKGGRILRLEERRDRCQVYVHPDHQAARPLAKVRAKVKPLTVDEQGLISQAEEVDLFNPIHVSLLLDELIQALRARAGGEEHSG